MNLAQKETDRISKSPTPVRHLAHVGGARILKPCCGIVPLGIFVTHSKALSLKALLAEMVKQAAGQFRTHGFVSFPWCIAITFYINGITARHVKKTMFETAEIDLQETVGKGTSRRRVRN